MKKKRAYLLPFLDQSMKVRMRNYLRNAHKENLLPFLHRCSETSEMTAANYLIIQKLTSLRAKISFSRIGHTMPGEVAQITWINRHSIASSCPQLKIHEIHLFIFAEAFNLALKQKWGFHVK